MLIDTEINIYNNRKTIKRLILKDWVNRNPRQNLSKDNTWRTWNWKKINWSPSKLNSVQTYCTKFGANWKMDQECVDLLTCYKIRSKALILWPIRSIALILITLIISSEYHFASEILTLDYLINTYCKIYHNSLVFTYIWK